MICKNCGYKLNDGQKFCPKCGCAVKSNININKNETSLKEDKKEISNADKKKARNRRIIISFLCFAIVAAAAVTYLFFYFGNFNNNQASGNDEEITSDYRQNELKSGDYTYCPESESINFDEQTNTLYFNNLIIVYTFDQLSSEDKNSLANLVGGELVGEINGNINCLQIKVSKSTLEELNYKAELISGNYSVLYAGYDYPLFLCENDTNPWNNSDELSDTVRPNEEVPDGNNWWAEAIGAYTAWEYDDDCQTVNVGIIDTGFDNNHEDLIGKISFPEDYSENSSTDHGTSVAGIISANDNSVGIRGIADKSNLICVDWTPITDDKTSPEYYDYISVGEYIEITKQLIENDVKVINNSWCNYVFSKDAFTAALYEEENSAGDSVIKFLSQYFAVNSAGAYDSYLQYLDTLSKRTALDCSIMMIELLLNGKEDFAIVQAAGNGYDNGGNGIDAKYSCFYCGFDESVFNVLSESTRNSLKSKNITFNSMEERIFIVGAVENSRDENGNYLMSTMSNYGNNVDVCAPGINVFSTIMNDKYKSDSGTSLAAPMVSASVALLWMLDPELSISDLRKVLLENSVKKAIGVGNGAGFSYPMLNIGASVKSIKKTNTIPEDAKVYKGNYYQVVDTALTWTQAKDYCESLGGHLATIKDKNEQKFIESIISENSSSTFYWLGGTDAEKDGDWKWLTSEKWNYSNWQNNEPNDDFENTEDYLGIWGSTYEWNDFTDDGSVEGISNCGFICEWDN